jgi:hypothetical protein
MTVTGEQLTLPIREDSSNIEAEPGVSVSLEDRVRALGSLAAIYTTLEPAYAKANGMVKALENPRHRKEMAKRYENPDDVAEAALREVTRRLRAGEVHHADTLVNAAGFAAHGMGEGDIETLMLQTAIEARQAIGFGVGSERRSEILSGLYIPKSTIEIM